jgi:PAS domain S-box-containing protein
MQEEHQYHRMIEEIEDYAILMLDPNGVIQNWNKGAERIKGYTEQEAVGMNFRMFYRQEDRDAGLPEQLIDTASREGKAVHEGWRVRKDGRAFWGSIVITALHDNEGKVVGFSKVTRDLTERKQSEDVIRLYTRQLEAQNEELQQFAYAAAHDLKEPLRKIQLYYSAITDGDGGPITPTQRQAYMEKSADAARRMQQLIDDLLAFSRVVGKEENFEPVDLNLVFDEVRAQFQDALDQTGTTVRVDPLPIVRGIPFQLSQLFNNLLSNSIKFRSIDRPPEISVSASRVRLPEMADAYNAGRYDRIEVRDNGIGFQPNEGERIFNLFERLHGRDQYSGNGMGLAICRRIMENNRGFIRARGVPGEGSTFDLYFKAE